MKLKPTPTNNLTAFKIPDRKVKRKQYLTYLILVLIVTILILQVYYWNKKTIKTNSEIELITKKFQIKIEDKQKEIDTKENKINELKKELEILRNGMLNENDIWYYDDPLYEQKNDPLVELFNKPHVLLQAYYDNFVSKNLIKKNIKYYSDTLLIHFNDTIIDSQSAIDKDYLDFSLNDIRSYQILVNSYGMVTEHLDYIDIVNVPLKYYITKMNGSRTKFNTNITAILNKSNDKIISISNSITISDLKRAVNKIK